MYEQKNKSSIKYILYARKSSEDSDRQVSSNADQIDEMQKLARRLNLNIIKVYKEEKSAKAPDVRTEFYKMLDSIKKDKADGILSWKLDRLSRNPLDSGRLQQLLQENKIKSIQTISKEYKPEDNALLMSVENGMSNQFILDLRVNSMRGTRKKAEKGWLPSRAPLGYINVGDIQGEKYIEPDEDRFDLVRKMWDMVLSGIQLSKIVKIAHEDWGLKNRKFKKSGDSLVSKTQIYSMFSNIFYTGKFSYMGKVYQGKHKPMITTEEFERVQIILKRKNKPRPSKYSYPYTGLIRCGCGCNSMITAYPKKEKYIYYKPTGNVKDAPKCTNSQISETRLEKQILNELSKIEINQLFLDWAFNQIDENVKNEMNQKEKIKLNKIKTIQDKRNELQRIQTMMQKGYYDSDEDFLEAKNNVLKEIENLEKEQSLEDAVIQKATKLKDSLIFLAGTKEILINSNDVEEKHNILYTVGMEHIYNKQRFTMVTESCFSKVRLCYKNLEKRYDRVELDKTLTKQGKNKAFNLVCSDWGRMIKEVRKRY